MPGRPGTLTESMVARLVLLRHSKASSSCRGRCVWWGNAGALWDGDLVCWTKLSVIPWLWLEPPVNLSTLFIKVPFKFNTILGDSHLSESHCSSVFCSGSCRQRGLLRELSLVWLNCSPWLVALKLFHFACSWERVSNTQGPFGLVTFSLQKISLPELSLI